MSNISRSTQKPGWRRVPLSVLIGIPVIAGLVVGVGVGSFADRAEVASTSAVISTRPASSLPNERIDLINDLQTALTLSPILDPVAESQGLSVDDLTAALSFERVDSSSFARLTFRSDALDAEARRAVLRQLLRVTTDFLTPVTPSPALIEARRTEKAATDAYYAALSANGGQTPVAQLARVRSQITGAGLAGRSDQVRQLERRVPGLVNKSRQFDLLEAARQRASATLQTLGADEADQSRGGPKALGVSYADNDSTAKSAVAAVSVRRGLAAGIATALVLVGLLLAIANSRGSRRDPYDDDLASSESAGGVTPAAHPATAHATPDTDASSRPRRTIYSADER